MAGWVLALVPVAVFALVLVRLNRRDGQRRRLLAAVGVVLRDPWRRGAIGVEADVPFVGTPATVRLSMDAWTAAHVWPLTTALSAALPSGTRIRIDTGPTVYTVTTTRDRGHGAFVSGTSSSLV
jgi:hypothetical protein